MAGTDSDGVNERLNGLVKILQAVGIDGVDSGALVEAQKRQSSSKSKRSSNKSRKKASTSSNNNNASSSSSSGSDAQILEIIKKLQQAQADSPELLEALKSPELLALASLAAQNQGVAQASSPPSPPPKPKPKRSMEACLADVMDDDDNYPKIGPGYSDEASVISEMSAVTVMTRQKVSDEEHYRELKGGNGGLPPMNIGGGGSSSRSAGRTSRIARPSSGATGGGGGGGKTKNMVGQVRPVMPRRASTSASAIPPPKTGGAAAQRRLNYQMAMNNLQSTGFAAPRGPTSPTPSAQIISKEIKKTRKNPSRTTSGTKSIGSSGSGSGSSRKKSSNNSSSSSSNNNTKTKNKNKNSDNIDWGLSDSNGWPTSFDENNESISTDVFLDNDGFFSQKNLFSSNENGSAGKAPKSSTNMNSTRRKKSSKSPTRQSSEVSSKKKSSRDDGSGTARKTRRVKKDKDKDNEDTSSEKTRKSKEKDKSSGRRKASRRASMTDVR